MGEDPKAKLAESIEALRAMLHGGSIDSNLYHKTLVGFAYEYFLLEATEDGLLLLNSIPEEYYRDVQMDQATQDPHYKETVLALADKLVDLGVLVKKATSEKDLVVAGFSFPQRPGKA